jgi:DNA-binding PadR family transcriptional regulator
MTSAGLARLRCSPPEDLEDDLLERLETACVLLLLHETPASSAQLGDALAALRLRRYPTGLEQVLARMEADGLLFSTWGPSDAFPQCHTFHIAPAGAEWLRDAADELQRSQGFLGAFVARCGEHLV